MCIVNDGILIKNARFSLCNTDQGVLMTQGSTKLVVVLGSFFALTACTDNPAQQYGNTMTQSHKSARNLDSKVNIIEVRKSIQEFYAANGRFPADLNELSGFNGITLKGDNYEYEPETGTLVEKK